MKLLSFQNKNEQLPILPKHLSAYKVHFSENNLWQKIKTYAKKAGAEIIEKSLWLFYTAKKPETPAWAKTTIYGALGYFISPIDIIPDITPIVGFTDDLGVLAAAIATIAVYIDDDVKQKAKAKMRQWFG